MNNSDIEGIAFANILENIENSNDKLLQINKSNDIKSLQSKLKEINKQINNLNNKIRKNIKK